MTPNTALESLADEITQLESETFEIADYAEANELFAMAMCSTCSSTTSTTSCSA